MTDQNCLEATYLVQIPRGERIEHTARALSRHFYPGTTSLVSGETAEAVKEYCGKIIEIEPILQYIIPSSILENISTFIVKIGIPILILEKSFAMLFSTIAGEILAFGKIKLVDVNFPQQDLENYCGKKFGIAGIRNILNVPDRPLLLAIHKPPLGFLPGRGADDFLNAALGAPIS